jgi:hypothetical protein
MKHRALWLTAAGFCLLCVVTNAGVVVAAERPAGWGRYRDRQLGMAFDFPSHVFSLKSAEQGQDGVVFSTPDGRARIRVFAVRNEANDTPQSYLRKIARPEEARFTYVRTTPRFFVASGTREGNIFYSRCNFRRAGQRVSCFQMDYPQSEKRAWDATVTRISLSLAAVD